MVKNPECVYEINSTYLLKNLTSELPKVTTVYLYGNRRINEFEIRNIKNIYGDFEIVNYNNLIYRYDNTDSDYFNSEPYTKKDILIYPSDNSFPDGLERMMFYYPGNLEDAKNYLAELMSSHGMSDFYVVYSVNNQYDIIYQKTLKALPTLVIPFVIFLLSIIFIDKQLLELNSTENARRYYLDYLEGRKVESFLLNITLNSLLFWAFVQAWFFLRERDVYSRLLMVVATIFLIEQITSFFSYQRITRLRKGRIDD